MEISSNIYLDGNSFSENLKVYLENNFIKTQLPTSTCAINNDDDFFWKKNITKCLIEKKSFINLLRNCFPQLNFPIEVDISKSPQYRDATLKGHFDVQEHALPFTDDIQVEYKDSFAGKIPIIIMENNDAFISLVQCLGYKNSPVVLPDTMGASFINGLNNWKKIHDIKENWLRKNLTGDWNTYFSNNILSDPSVYKDKIILLSSKPYSIICAETFKLPDLLWQEYSMTIRKYHELTHFYTLQKYGCASNNLHDELIADYVGIIKTVGYYDKKWMLTFMGLENYPQYRSGSRLENYLSSQDHLDFEELKILFRIIKNAIENLSIFDQAINTIKTDGDLHRRIDALCETNLLDIASPAGASLLIDKYNLKQIDTRSN